MQEKVQLGCPLVLVPKIKKRKEQMKNQFQNLYQFHEQFEKPELAEKSLKDEIIWSNIGRKKNLKISKSYQQAYRYNRVRCRER